MSTPDDWIEEARIERMLIERRPSNQTGFYDVLQDDVEDDDRQWWQQQDEELQRQEEEQCQK